LRRRGGRADRRALARSPRRGRRGPRDPLGRRRVPLHHAARARARRRTMSGREVTVAAIQCPLGGPRAENLARVEKHVRDAAAPGARSILPPELFEGPYFCRDERTEWFAEARGVDDDEAVARMRVVARELGVVIPVSFFERAGQAYYNSVAVIDAGGEVLGVYRKSHIPDGPGYEEKFYFRPGDSGFRVWQTRFAAIGVGICWDQWFPESARAMMLMGAEV